MPNSGEINRTKLFCSPWRIKGTTFSWLVPKRYMFRFKGHSGKIIIGGKRKLWLLRQRTCAVYNRTLPSRINSSCCKKSVQIVNWIFHPLTRCLHRATKEFPFLLQHIWISPVSPCQQSLSLWWSAWQLGFLIRCSLQPILKTFNEQSALQPWKEFINDLSPAQGTMLDQKWHNGQ